MLAGDIGATNARLAIFEEDGPLLQIIAHTVYASSEYSSLEEIVGKFLRASGLNFDSACFGLPGPVSSDETIVLTNLPWLIERKRLKHRVNTEKFALINDVEASALGIPTLSGTDLRTINEGRTDPNGNRAVISIGTGLGVAGLSPGGRAFATEAGHADFSPSDDFDVELHRSLQTTHGHVSWERVASGPALIDILNTVAHQRSMPPPSLSGAAIVTAAHDGSNELCTATLEIFQRYVGSAAGNIALSLGATGGIYFTGGVTGNIFDRPGTSRILNSFFDKGRMRPFLEHIPVKIVVADNIALRGAARRALAL